MFVVLKSPFVFQVLSFATLLVCSSVIYAAPHSSQLDDFHANCNFRQLNLSQEQHSALRRIRSDYKVAADKAYKKEQRTDRTRRLNIMKILTNPNFDQNNARDYVESRYLSHMDFAVDELAIQHRIYHLLSPSQRQIWLDSCLR
ncbi:Spy/CpxP family protein refolding chaperone [Neisseria yangbaofengii]|uniref:Spy/CpxP family protein refolding chaperone n=1 Tax=Neisseria yangbaofengii TaxID=2709396 RepID=UPI003530BC44